MLTRCFTTITRLSAVVGLELRDEPLRRIYLFDVSRYKTRILKNANFLKPYSFGEALGANLYKTLGARADSFRVFYTSSMILCFRKPDPNQRRRMAEGTRRPPPRYRSPRQSALALVLLLALAVPSQPLQKGGARPEPSSLSLSTSEIPAAGKAESTADAQEVASLLSDSRLSALDPGRQRVEALQAAAVVGIDIAYDASDRAAARLKAAGLLKGIVVDGAMREAQRLRMRTAAIQRRVLDGLAEAVWVVTVTATVGGALFARRVTGWGDTGDGGRASGKSRVPSTPEEAAEEVRLKEEIRRHNELPRRAAEADQNPTIHTDVEMRRRGVGHQMGLFNQLLHLRGGVSSPEERERVRLQEREADVHRAHDSWRLRGEVAAAGCGAMLGSTLSLAMSLDLGGSPDPSYPYPILDGGATAVSTEMRLAGSTSLGTVFGALLCTMAWLHFEPWAVANLGFGPRGVAERAAREWEWNEVPGAGAMRPRRHRAGGALQREDTDTNIDVMLAASHGESSGSGGSGEGQQQRMPDWLKRKLLGMEDPEPTPLPPVLGSVSAVRDRWTQQLREIEELAAANTPATTAASARPVWDSVGMADPEWDDMVAGEAAASQSRAEAGRRGSFARDAGVGGVHQQPNLYNVLQAEAQRTNDGGGSWLRGWK